MPQGTLRVPASERDAERPGLHSHAERGNDQNPGITLSKFFDELTESVQQMNEIVRGERQPSREFHVDALKTLPRSTWERSSSAKHQKYRSIDQIV
ncbi:hypothetical protein PFAS1_09865 [Pseudomonas frederiksbergensis]|nr:hypothetical protein PFAS1_09865 [Pseudomonas frederiksbergensis]